MNFFKRLASTFVVTTFYLVYVPIVRYSPGRIAWILMRSVCALHGGLTKFGLSNQRAKRNLQQQFGRQHHELISRYVQVQHRNFFCFQRFVAGKSFYEASLFGEEHLDRVLAEGNGGILVSFHFGLFRSEQIVLRQRGYPAVTVRDPPPHYEKRLFTKPNQWVKQLHRNEETRAGNEVIYVSDGVVFPKLVKRLRRNQLISIKVDGFMADDFRMSSLMGLPIALPTGFARLAVSTGVPIIPIMFYAGEEGGPEEGIVIDEPIRVSKTCNVDEVFDRTLAQLNRLAIVAPSNLLTLQHIQKKEDGTYEHVGG